MKHTILFLIIFLCSIIKGSSEESLLLNFPTELLYKILYRLKFEERKNLLQTCSFFHSALLGFILYEQNLEIKKEKITKKFIDNNKLFFSFSDTTLKSYNITKDEKEDEFWGSTGILIRYNQKENKDICVARGNNGCFDPVDREKKINYFYWMHELYDCMKDRAVKFLHSFRCYDTDNFPQIKTLFIDLVKNKEKKYESEKNPEVKKWEVNLAMFAAVENIIIRVKGVVDTIYFPEYISTAVIKSPVTNIIFRVPDYEVIKKLHWAVDYNKMRALYNHFYITDLSIVVNDTENEDENNDNHWSKVLTKLPLKRLKITFYNEKSKRINSRKLELNNSLNVNLKELILKNCNRPVKLPEILEELYIINPEKNFQLYNFFNSFDKEQLLSVVAYKGKLVNAEKVSSVRGKHVMIESYLHDYIKIIHYNEVEKLTIKNSPTLKTIFISNNKNLKKENCFCDNPAVKWISLD